MRARESRIIFLYTLLTTTLVSVGGLAWAQSSKLADDPDIASYRPRFNAHPEAGQEEATTPSSSKKYSKPKLDVTRKLNQGLDSVYERNKQIKYAQGYRVLVYSGTDKVVLNQLKQKVYKLFPDVEVYTVFKQPEYRISFGDFIDKIQAYNYLVKIQNSVPDALIVQDQINIRSQKR